MATFSLHPVKAFTSAEGGIVTCNDDRVEKELRLLINHGMIREAGDFVATDQALDAEGTTNPWYYELQSPGLNYRLNDVSCALGRSQLRKLPDFIERRRQLVGHYRECLCSAAVEEIRWIADGHQTAIGWHLFVVLIDFEGLKTSRAEVMRELSRVGVGSQVHYLPVHRQPYYRTLDESLHLPGADRYYERCLSLPLFPAMDESHVERVVEQLVRIVKNPRL